MHRYLLFAGQAYYPFGGAEDLQGSYATMIECMQSDGVFTDWWNVLDTRSGRVYCYHDVEFDRRLEWAAGIDSES